MAALSTRLKLRHYRLIAAIARHGQLSIAADHLALTQPAASRALAEIERMTEAELFERHPKGMRLTPIGEVMARHASILLGGLEVAEDELSAFRSGFAGRVRIGAVTGAAVGYVVPAIRELKRAARTVEIKVDVAPSVALIAGLMNGELDFALCRLPTGVDPDLFEILLGREEHLAVLVRADHPLAGKPSVGLAELQDCTWVAQEHGMPIREAVEEAHALAGIRGPRDVIESSSLLMTIAYLMASDAVSPVAKEVSELLRGTKRGGVTTLDMKERIVLTPYFLIRLKQRPISPLAQRLMGLVLGRLSDGGPMGRNPEPGADFGTGHLPMQPPT